MYTSNAADHAAVRLYDQSRENGSYHELALRIATAAWRKHYPETAVAEAEHVVRSAVGMARAGSTPGR
jgi:hypothetical protein